MGHINYIILIFGIIGGTALAFYFFIDSLQYISAKETTLFGTVEPVVAVIASSLWLHVAFKPFQIVGIILIMILILLLSLKRQPETLDEENSDNHFSKYLLFNNVATL